MYIIVTMYTYYVHITASCVPLLPEEFILPLWLCIIAISQNEYVILVITQAKPYVMIQVSQIIAVLIISPTVILYNV